MKYIVADKTFSDISVLQLKEKDTISYEELARRVGDMIMCNNIMSIDEDMYSNLENGNLYHEDNDDDEDYTKEIYQFFLITKGGADYLKRNTDEIVFYSEKLDLHVWGITHFGTPWNGVYTEITSI